MRSFVWGFIELFLIALSLTGGIAMVTSVFVLRVALNSEYPRRPAEGVILGIGLVMIALKMIFNRIRP